MLFYSSRSNKIHGKFKWVNMVHIYHGLVRSPTSIVCSSYICSSQIPFIPQSTASYHILNNPLVSCLVWIWKAHFTQVRNADIHLVLK